MTPLVKAQYKNQYAIQFMNSQNKHQSIKQINKETGNFLILTETESNLFSRVQKQVPQQMRTCVIFNVSQDVILQ